MKKLHGQMELVDDNVPVMDNKEVAEKLEQVWKLHENAKLHDSLLKEAKEEIKAFCMSMNKRDAAAGQVRCGDFLIDFKVEMAEAKPVSYETKPGKKVTLKLAPADEEEA